MPTSRRDFISQTLAIGSASMGLPSQGIGSPAKHENIPSILTTNRDPQNHNDPHLHLLIDDAEIAHMENLRRVLNRLKKYPEPILVADRPWEGERAQAWGSVIQEPDGLFRMWYFAMNTRRRWDTLDRGGYCYAESRDGVH